MIFIQSFDLLSFEFLFLQLNHLGQIIIAFTYSTWSATCTPLIDSDMTRSDQQTEGWTDLTIAFAINNTLDTVRVLTYPG